MPRRLQKRIEVIQGESFRDVQPLSLDGPQLVHAPWHDLLNFASELMQSINVLVIEDSQVHVQLIRGMLAETKAASFAVEVFERLGAGLDRMDDGNIDAVLLDLTLPDSSGVESCKRVTARAPTLPIVVLTGDDDEETAIEALKCGAQDYLVKNQINGDLLSRSLRYAIERKRGELELKRARDELEQRVIERTEELREKEQELAHIARLNTLGELASGIAHELNQPLMAIRGFADVCNQIVGDEQIDQAQLVELLGDISSQSERAAEIIKRLRKLVSRRPSERSSVGLNELIRETITLLGSGFTSTISLELDDDLVDIEADRVQIQQVLLNLMNNAIQEMESSDVGQRRLTIRSGTDQAEETVYVDVSDTGPGLAEEDLAHLFDPFFTRKPDGLGLGLSISRSIIDAHGGQFRVEKNRAGGLTFRFCLPLQ